MKEKNGYIYIYFFLYKQKNVWEHWEHISKLSKIKGLNGFFNWEHLGTFGNIWEQITFRNRGD